MTPKPDCDSSPPSSSFSVTGFLTFSVVAATSLANIIANINNNNNNNNDNNNNENQNDNNQISNNAMMEGRKKKRSTAQKAKQFDICEQISIKESNNTSSGFLSAGINYMTKFLKICPERYICDAVMESTQQSSKINQKIGIFVTTISAFILSDFIPSLPHENAFGIIQNATEDHEYCLQIKC